VWFCIRRAAVIIFLRFLTFLHSKFQKDGTFIDLEITTTYLKETGNRIFSFLRDITEKKKNDAELKKYRETLEELLMIRTVELEKLRAMSFLDELTGLYNQRGFANIAGQQVKLANRTKRGMLLIYVDVDHLKKIIDDHGQAEGDRALVETANILKKTFRSSDIIARMGGDEFAVLALDTNQEYSATLNARLNSNLDKFNTHKKYPYTLTLSRGITHYHTEMPCSIDELLTRANKLMHADKMNRA
jgi:diguanylate cyclase (GGDEF)-like protein